MESIRLYPSGTAIPKIAMESISIPTATSEGEPGPALFVPKYTDILIDAVALHRNRTHSLLLFDFVSESAANFDFQSTIS